ncbi:MAG: S1C family serine protease, partial [Mycobacteriales bacterium]
TAPWWLSAQEADSAPPPSHPDAGPASAGETIGGAAEAPPGDVSTPSSSGSAPSSAPALPDRSPWRRRTAAAALIAAVALGSGVTGAAVAGQFAPERTTLVTSAVPASVAAASTSSPTELLAKVAAAVQPSVVSITVRGSSGSDEGSGVVLRSDGTVLTNNHVIAAAADGGTIAVKFSSGRTASATILGRDPTTDLAVIKATGVSAGLAAATLGSSSSVHVGDTVLAIGSPLGLEGSVTAGIVSALHRTVQLGSSQDNQGGGLPGQSSTSPSVGDAVQTDAAINPGNSGGPLVDDSGRVIGINTAIASLGSSSGQPGSIGVGFAIPIDAAKTTAEQLIAGRTPAHAVLGVQITDGPSGGALVSSVISGGAAAAAGLRAGDVISRVDATAIGGADDLSAAIRSHSPGEAVSVRFARNGQERTAKVTLGRAAG